MFNKFFASCWNTSELPLPEEVYSIQYSFCDQRVTPDEVFHLINALDTNKAIGPDNISAFMLKATAERALQNHWLNCSLFCYQKVNSPNCGKLQALCQFQSPLTKAKVIQLSIYRPISRLSIVSKLLERIVHSILWEHLVEYTSISDMQWGLKKNKSIYYFHTTHDWFTLLDQQMEIMCFLFQKGFRHCSTSEIDEYTM